MSPRPIAPLAVPHGPAVLEILDRLADALAGAGPAVAPHAAGTEPPPLPGEHSHLPADLALAIGTSGSTGRPKLTLLSRHALQASAAATHLRLGGPGQWVLAMPAHHIAGLQVLLRSLAAGTTPRVVDLQHGFTADEFARATATLDPAQARHYTALVPTQLVRLLDDDAGREALQRYDAALLGGAPAPASLLARARDVGVHVVTTYGMTETAGGCVYDGTPLVGTQIRFDSDGRVSLGGPTVAAGYLDLTASLEDIRREAATSSFGIEEGISWFRTDDLGHLDDDGRLVVDGRIDDLVNTGGVKVAPRLVEDALICHVQQITEAVVVGSPDDEWGHVVSAAVVVAQGDPPLRVRRVRDQLRGILPDHALPRRLLVLDQIPLRGPGKPDRDAIRRLFADADTYD